MGVLGAVLRGCLEHRAKHTGTSPEPRPHGAPSLALWLQPCRPHSRSAPEPQAPSPTPARKCKKQTGPTHNCNHHPSIRKGESQRVWPKKGDFQTASLSGQGGFSLRSLCPWGGVGVLPPPFTHNYGHCGCQPHEALGGPAPARPPHPGK